MPCLMIRFAGALTDVADPAPERRVEGERWRQVTIGANHYIPIVPADVVEQLPSLATKTKMTPGPLLAKQTLTRARERSDRKGDQVAGRDPVNAEGRRYCPAKTGRPIA